MRRILLFLKQYYKLFIIYAMLIFVVLFLTINLFISRDILIHLWNNDVKQENIMITVKSEYEENLDKSKYTNDVEIKKFINLVNKNIFLKVNVDEKPEKFKLSGINNNKQYFEYYHLSLIKKTSKLNPYEIIIPQSIAKEYNIKLGDEINFNVPNSLIQSWYINPLIVTNIYDNQENPKFNRIYTSNTTIREISKISAIHATKDIILIAKNKKELDNITSFINTINNKFSKNKKHYILKYDINNDLYIQVIKPLEKLQKKVFVVDIILLVLLIIFKSYLINYFIKKRKNEFKILFYMGYTRLNIIKLIICERIIFIVPIVLISIGISYKFNIYLFKYILSLYQQLLQFSIDNYNVILMKLEFKTLMIIIIVCIIVFFIEILYYNENLKKVKENV